MSSLYITQWYDSERPSQNQEYFRYVARKPIHLGLSIHIWVYWEGKWLNFVPMKYQKFVFISNEIFFSFENIFGSDFWGQSSLLL